MKKEILAHLHCWVYEMHYNNNKTKNSTQARLKMPERSVTSVLRLERRTCLLRINNDGSNTIINKYSLQEAEMCLWNPANMILIKKDITTASRRKKDCSCNAHRPPSVSLHAWHNNLGSKSKSKLNLN